MEETTDGGVMFGKNPLSAMSTLWSVARLPLTWIPYALESTYGLRHSPATIEHALKRVAEGLEGFQEKVRKIVSRSKRAKLRRDRDARRGEGGWMEEGRSREKVRVRRGHDEQGGGRCSKSTSLVSGASLP